MSCFWSKHFDPSSRKYYYHDSDTQATAWELPAGSFAADSAHSPNQELVPKFGRRLLTLVSPPHATLTHACQAPS